MDPFAIVVLGAYAWLVLEITCFPVPCESSTYQLLFRAAEDGHAEDHLARARRRSPFSKLCVYFLPTALGVVLFLIPPVAVFVPRIIDGLLRVTPFERVEVRWLGVTLVLGGRALTFVSVLQLRAERASGKGAVRVRGLFRLSRNPGLVGMYAFYLGNCLLFPCVVLFLGFVPYVVNMHRRVLMEESWLLRHGGESFRRYLEQVPRYLRGLP